MRSYSAPWPGALFFSRLRGRPRPALAHEPPTATCQGDQSAGIASGAAAPPADFPNTFTTLHVNNLTTDITPAANVDGIYFHGTTSVTINSDTGPFSIFTTGSEAFGIEAAGSSVTITHTGDIASDSIGNNAGIHAAASSGIATIVSQGDITLTAGTADGILAEGLNGVSVTHTGNLTANFRGISAGAPTGTVSVVSIGNIVVNNDSLFLGAAGIYADGTDAAANIRHEGRINSTSYGILVHTGAAADVANIGPIASRFTGISARSDAEGVTVNQTGDITSTDGTAIVARSGGGNTVVNTDREVVGAVDGIYAYAPNGQFPQNVSVTVQGGSVRGGVGEGVEISFGGDNSLVNHGTITSESGAAIRPISEMRPSRTTDAFWG